jgi:hypothetical protein
MGHKLGSFPQLVHRVGRQTNRAEQESGPFPLTADAASLLLGTYRSARAGSLGG